MCEDVSRVGRVEDRRGGTKISWRANTTISSVSVLSRVLLFFCVLCPLTRLPDGQAAVGGALSATRARR